jgi:hypothetical protein
MSLLWLANPICHLGRRGRGAAHPHAAVSRGPLNVAREGGDDRESKKGDGGDDKVTGRGYRGHKDVDAVAGHGGGGGASSGT